jgi:cardiolipin synthase
MTSRVFSPANQLTILRLTFIPVFAVLVLAGHFGFAFGILAAAAISDALDGAVARLTGEVTPVGVALDPIADKILMSTAFIILSYRHALPWWLTVVVLSRDAGILLTALLISLVAGYRPFYPTMLGKTATAVQVTTVLLAMARLTWPFGVANFWLKGFVDLTAFFTVASALHYLLVVRQRYAEHATGEIEKTAP